MAHASQSDEDWHRDRAVVAQPDPRAADQLPVFEPPALRRGGQGGQPQADDLRVKHHLRRDLLSHNQPLLSENGPLHFNLETL
ncbi:hypothetical protein DIPPA_01874 [Diplonema papillatum]|nr:hypothetical protein DIPPA_01874 [Diplonema papillatum]